MLGRGHNAGTFVCNVVLHASLLIDGQFNTFVDRGTKSSVILRGIFVIGIIFGVVNVVFGAIAAKTLSCDFEFLCTKSEGHESENPKEDTDGLCRNILYGTDVDCLSYGKSQHHVTQLGQVVPNNYDTSKKDHRSDLKDQSVIPRPQRNLIVQYVKVVGTGRNRNTHSNL